MSKSILSFMPAVVILVCFPAMLLAQNPAGGTQLTQAMGVITDAELGNPAPEDWLMWRRTYDSAGYSPLEQINRGNVGNLTEAWRTALLPGPNMATPLVHDGVMFVASTQDTIVALDASNGEELWSYRHESMIFPGAKMGIALHGDKVIFPTQDLRVLALDSRSGELLWNHQIITTQSGSFPYSLRSAPIVANGVVVQGVTATMIPEGGFIVGIDAESGAELWRFHSVARPGQLGGNTWNNLSLADRSGGSIWVPASYDAELDLVYFGTAPTYDTAPLLHAIDEPGVSNEALFTNSTIALRPGSGELVWYFQHMPNDQWDLDWVYERQIVQIQFEGSQRKAIVTAGKMALYDVLDAASGEYLFSVDVGLQNIVTGVDPETGDKTLHPNAIPNSETGHLLCPFANGGRNWQSAAVNPSSRMLYLPLAEVCMMAGPTSDTPSGIMSTGVPLNPMPMADSDGQFGRLQAINLDTGELAWNFREVVPPASAALATAGGLVFVGSVDGSFKAFDDATGRVLWSQALGDVPATFPISYAVNGQQYIALVVGQPSLHANLWIGTITSFLGEENSPLVNVSRSGPAVVVFALPR